VPVAAAAISDLASGTQDAVKTVSRAVAEGVGDTQGDKKPCGCSKNGANQDTPDRQH